MTLKETKILISIILSIMLFIYSIYFIKIIYQEDSPIKTLKALYDIKIRGKEYSYITDQKYLLSRTKNITRDPNNTFCTYHQELCNDLKIKYIDQLGAQLIILKDNKKTCAWITSFTRKNTVINFDCEYKF